MARSRREFTPEYKDEAVKLVLTTGRAVATVARELGINEATLGRWVTAFKGRNETGQTEVTESERAELLRLRKENADLKMDRAFLKKRPSSSPRKRRIRTASVRTDAGGEDQLHYHPHGPSSRGLPVGLLRWVGHVPWSGVVPGLGALD
ncbi:transposase [Cryobacterium sp. TMT4-10]|uniref:transposase n=1 Tax=Cryobacterium sp. TMT4-10 TaxID=1259256 RepID=UPI00141A9038|nr:transposase [Cryobacterium sp. TMT4-10]